MIVQAQESLIPAACIHNPIHELAVLVYDIWVTVKIDKTRHISYTVCTRLQGSQLSRKRGNDRPNGWHRPPQDKGDKIVIV